MLVGCILFYAQARKYYIHMGTSPLSVRHMLVLALAPMGAVRHFYPAIPAVTSWALVFADSSKDLAN